MRSYKAAKNSPQQSSLVYKRYHTDQRSLDELELHLRETKVQKIRHQKYRATGSLSKKSITIISKKFKRKKVYNALE